MSGFTCFVSFVHSAVKMSLDYNFLIKKIALHIMSQNCFKIMYKIKLYLFVCFGRKIQKSFHTVYNFLYKFVYLKTVAFFKSKYVAKIGTILKAYKAKIYLTTFSYRQLIAPLIFVQFSSNFLCMYTDCVANVHVSLR